ncbi:MAG: hypothetical protein NXY57DRAFT_967352 [Lentinula lateritia]|nr:MAG: hypothetical protein NXY57DRAFT_967352 [Lentinula lateritia]
MNTEEEPPAHHGVYAPSPWASNFPTHSWRDDDKVTDSEDETIGYSSHSSEYSDTDRSILNDFQLQNTDPASTPKPPIDSQIPESMENVFILSSPEALYRQLTTEPIMSGIEDQIPTKASSSLTTDTPMGNSASSLLGHTMDNLDTRGKNNSAGPSEGSDCLAEELGRPSERPGYHSKGGHASEGSGHPSEGSGCPSEGSDPLKWFQSVVIVDDLQLSRILFKAGALIYLLFLIRALQKIYAMFWNQPLAVAVGSLICSIVLFILIQYHPPTQVQLKVTNKFEIPQVAVDAIIFIGSFTCVSFVLQMILIIGELVAY